jgi:hypothetical protein
MPAAAPATSQNPAVPESAPAAAQSGATETQDALPAAQDSEGSADQSPAQPLAQSLETGLPLRTVMSPLHWGHLSLLSFQAFGAYNQDNQQQISRLGNQFGGLQGLVVYAIQKERSAVDLQYQPYVWFSQNRTYKDFTANSVDFTTSHIFNRRWSIAGNDRFQYSPNLANTLQSAFAADFVNNASSEAAFMSVGRKALFNSANVTVNTQLSANSRLSFSGIDDYVQLGSYVGSVNTTTLPLASERLNAYGGTAGWTRQWSARNTIMVSYNYRRQSLSGLGADTTFNAVDLGFTRVLMPSLTFSVQAGPGWSDSVLASDPTQKQRRTTVQGSASLFKSFHNGGVAISFARSSQFTGVISNSYNNRYNVAFNRRFFTRWNFEADGSYIQQEYAGLRSTTGELGWAELGCMLTRNWSAFSGYRYLRMKGTSNLPGEQEVIAVGIRWAWQPEAARN